MSAGSELPVRARAEAELLASGGPFEVVERDVLGTRLGVFRERLPSLREMLRNSAAFGDREYIVYEDRRISFSDHYRAVCSIAQALRERYGVGKGDRVAILAANCPEWIATWWAAVSLGAIAVGLNGWWVRDEILYGLADCDPKLLVADRKRLARISGDPVEFPVVEIESEFEALWSHEPGAALSDAPIHEDDPASILYTSGTTGRPKGAVNTHRNIVCVNRLQTYHGLRTLRIAMLEGAADSGAPPAQNCMLVNTPLFHLSGLYTGAVTLLASGVKTVWTRGRFEPGHVLEIMERERVTSWGPMGTMFHRLASHPDLGKYDLSSVRQVGSGGAPISAELQERMREVFPNARASMSVGYGLTECTGMATICFGEELEKHPDSVGAPLPSFEIEIRDEHGRALPEGEEGEIQLRGPMVMLEYWRSPEASAETILPGRWLRTGDVGRLEDGRLYVNSRKRDLILRGGENVYPAEIELRLEAHPDVAEAAVVGVAHPELGQQVKAIVVPAPGAEPVSDALSEWVGEALAYYKVPTHWELRADPLPRNASGKVVKSLLAGDADNPFVED